MRRDANEEFWQHILYRAHRDIGAILADTVGVQPSKDAQTWDLVQRLIDLEAELTK